MRSLSVMLFCAIGFAIPAAQAESAASYCSEMYPLESYEPEERGEYIRDCLSSYGEDVPEQVSQTEEYDGTDTYSDRTVEQYVDSEGTEADPVNEEPEPSEYDGDEEPSAL